MEAQTRQELDEIKEEIEPRYRKLAEINGFDGRLRTARLQF